METEFAVITGASSGIGLELARQFGRYGFEILIVASTDDIFDTQELLEEEGIVVEAMKVNLATYAGVENLLQGIKNYGKNLSAIAINAGVGVGGNFIHTPLREEINLINLNIVSVVHLTKRILPLMQQEGRGRILYTSSLSSELPSPFEAVYGASKAFVQSFAAAIRNEVRETGISISICMPEAKAVDDTKDGTEMKFQNDPEEVARQGFEALMEGKDNVFTESFLTKLQGYALKILPEKAKAQLHRKWSEPQHEKH